MYIKEDLYQQYTLLEDSLGKSQTSLKESCLRRDELLIKVSELHDRLRRDQLQLNEYEEFYRELAQSLNLEDAENYMMYRAAHQQLECEAIKCKDEIDDVDYSH